MMSVRNKSPFTATQWQELEQQTLIFKYMLSGVPVPPDLLSTVKRNLESSRFFTHQPIGWGCFQMGFGRKADPEPGRCRRTDGKKWRCSKEAHPDSKYCERHMHRGRNRSRKPVEINNISSSTNSSQSNPNSLSPLSSAESYPFLSPDSSSSRPPGSFLSPQNNTTHHLFLNSAGSYSQQTDKDYSYVRGVRNEVDERSLNDSFTPLTMSSPTVYPQLHFQSPTGTSREQQQQQQQQERHCFILGTDFKSSRPITVEREEEEQKPFHHFFGEWQPKSREYSWLDVEGNQSSHAKFTTTQLSISMPPSKQELYGSKSTSHTDG